MSETSAGHDTATTAGRTTTAAGTGGSPQLSAMQELAIEYKTSIAASIGGAAGALIGYVITLSLFWIMWLTFDEFSFPLGIVPMFLKFEWMIGDG